jgi:hypothetical protein
MRSSQNIIMRTISSAREKEVLATLSLLAPYHAKPRLGLAALLGTTSRHRSSNVGSRKRTPTPQQWLQDTDLPVVRIITLCSSLQSGQEATEARGQRQWHSDQRMRHECDTPHIGPRRVRKHERKRTMRTDICTFEVYDSGSTDEPSRPYQLHQPTTSARSRNNDPYHQSLFPKYLSLSATRCTEASTPNYAVSQLPYSPCPTTSTEPAPKPILQAYTPPAVLKDNANIPPS